MINACGHYLIVKLDPVDDEIKSAGGLILSTGKSNKKREQAAGSYATVINVGPNCWTGFTDPDGNWNAWCKADDRVMIAQYAGQAFPVPDNVSNEEKDDLALIRLIKDDDVLAVVEV